MQTKYIVRLTAEARVGWVEEPKPSLFIIGSSIKEINSIGYPIMTKRIFSISHRSLLELMSPCFTFQKAGFRSSTQPTCFNDPKAVRVVILMFRLTSGYKLWRIFAPLHHQ
jgi:hypothetical protein